MTRTRMVLIFSTAALALTACATEPAAEISQVAGPSRAVAADAADLVAVADEADALRAAGLDAGLAEAAAPGSSAAAADGVRRRAMARHLRQNTLHGEIVVRGRDGAVRTVVVQRGAVTAVDGRAVTVKSADGWTLTWTLAQDVRVRQNRARADVAAVKAGAQVGVAGARDGETATARLVVIG